METGRALLAALRELFLRELDRLEDRIRAYRDEGALWRSSGTAPNPGGNLALHVAGNLSHYVGRVLGGDDFERDRDAEFGDRDVPRDEILRRIREARDHVDRTLGALPASRLQEPFPDPPRRFRGRSTLFFLQHLLTHLSYHLGQLDYHRRMLEEE